MKKIAIYGTGGVGRGVLQIIEDINEVRGGWEIIGFLDDQKDLSKKEIHGYPLLGDYKWLQDNPEVYTIIAVGNSALRQSIYKKIKNSQFATLIHPKTWISKRAKIDEGSVIYPGVKINTEANINKHVLINMNCTIGHDAKLDDFVTLAPGVQISGFCFLKEGVDLGSNSTVIQNLEIGEWSIIGAGAVVNKKIPPNVTAVGVPAKEVKKRKENWQKTTEK